MKNLLCRESRICVEISADEISSEIYIPAWSSARRANYCGNVKAMREEVENGVGVIEPSLNECRVYVKKNWRMDKENKSQERKVTVT